MARPHIDFLQSQALSWQASPWPYLPGCHQKTLSHDADTGAVSLLVRFPSGWSAPGPGPLATGEELFVLDGLLVLDGRRYGPDCYGWFPGGWRHTVRAAPDGAVALVFFGATPQCDAAATARTPAGSLLIDTFDLPWATDAPGAGFGGAGRHCKVLQGSPARGPATLLLASPPQWSPPRWCGPRELHAGAEELFLLSGDFLSPTGAMAAGAYCWLPPHVAHGPYGSRGGNLALLRTHGAPFATDYTAHELALERSPAYQPELPDGMRALGSRPWRPQRY